MAITTAGGNPGKEDRFLPFKAVLREHGSACQCAACMVARNVLIEYDKELDDERENERLLALYELWDQFSDVPVTEDGCLDETFCHFRKGTDREVVWHWFEEQDPRFIIGDIMNGICLC